MFISQQFTVQTIFQFWTPPVKIWQLKFTPCLKSRHSVLNIVTTKLLPQHQPDIVGLHIVSNTRPIAHDKAAKAFFKQYYQKRPSSPKVLLKLKLAGQLYLWSHSQRATHKRCLMPCRPIMIRVTLWEFMPARSHVNQRRCRWTKIFTPECVQQQQPLLNFLLHCNCCASMSMSVDRIKNPQNPFL